MQGGTTAGVAASDRAISSLAIVKVNYDRRHSFLENFAPFLRHCLNAAKPEEMTVPDLQESIGEEFGLTLPQEVIKTILRRERRAGRVDQVERTQWIARDALDEADLEADRADARRQQAALVEAIMEFAEKLGADWIPSHTHKLLMEYLDAFSGTVLAAAVAGKSVSERPYNWVGDQYIVHKFVLHAARANPGAFAFLEMVVKGKMLADAVYLGQHDEDKPGATPLGKLDVYFDGPILLHLLGHGGPELAAPYGELVGLLKEQGANVRCFKESVAEAQNILDVGAEKARAGNTGAHFHGDVVAYLIGQGMSSSDIKLLAAKLEADLLARGVQAVGQPPPDSRLTVDEQGLEQLLEERVGYGRKTKAIVTDIEALTAIHRLRSGREARTLANCKAIFVTQNEDLARASAMFFEQHKPGLKIPSCLHESAFTTMVWLNRPLGAPKLPHDRIIADAYAAMNPGDRLWRLFNKEIEHLRTVDDLTDEDVHILRVGDESREALMDETLGDDEAYLPGTALQVLERAREAMRKDVKRELHEEREARKEAERRLKERSDAIEARAQQIGRVVARLLFTVIIPVLAAGLIFGPLGPLNDGWSPLPRWAQAICTVAVILFTVWGLWSGASLKKAAGCTARFAERQAAKLLERLTR
jgi:hypothetical protein